MRDSRRNFLPVGHLVGLVTLQTRILWQESQSWKGGAALVWNGWAVGLSQAVGQSGSQAVGQSGSQAVGQECPTYSCETTYACETTKNEKRPEHHARPFFLRVHSKTSFQQCIIRVLALSHPYHSRAIKQLDLAICWC
jgi:hypothetical protein